MGSFQGLNKQRTQQLEPQLPEARQQGFAPASQNMAMLSSFQVAHCTPVSTEREHSALRSPNRKLPAISWMFS